MAEKINPILIAGGAAAALFLISRAGRADDDGGLASGEPDPPSTQDAEAQGPLGVGSRVQTSSTGDFADWLGSPIVRARQRPALALEGAEGYAPSEGYAGAPAMAQVYDVANFGMVCGGMAGTGVSIRGNVTVSMPATWAAGSSTPFGEFSGLRTANGALRVRQDRRGRLHTLNAGRNSGVFPSSFSVNRYYDARNMTSPQVPPGIRGFHMGGVGGDPGQGKPPQAVGWSLIPAGYQLPWSAQFTANEIPDTELGPDAFNARISSGQISPLYADWAESNVVRREGFYHEGEFFVRTDGPYGSKNWNPISDAHSYMKYFVSENGFVALDTRTMTNAFNNDTFRNANPAEFWQNLSPRWKGLPYGAVPYSHDPWQIAPFSSVASRDISGGWSSNRQWYWSPNHPISEYALQPGPNMSQWSRRNGNVDASPVRNSYPNNSAFRGGGFSLRKTTSGGGSYGCRRSRCQLTVVESGSGSLLAPGYGVVQGPGRAPFDFAAPTVLEAFVRTKMQFYRADIRFSGDS